MPEIRRWRMPLYEDRTVLVVAFDDVLRWIRAGDNEQADALASELADALGEAETREPVATPVSEAQECSDA